MKAFDDDNDATTLRNYCRISKPQKTGTKAESWIWIPDIPTTRSDSPSLRSKEESAIPGLGSPIVREFERSSQNTGIHVR